MVKDYVYAVLLYCLWQVMYLVKTEVVDKERFDADPSLVTSLRWLSKDTKNPLARKILRVLRKIGVFGEREEYDSTSMKTKLVFVASQLLLTVVSMLPTPLAYYSPIWMLLYIGVIFTVAVYNGASYYIEVFSQRYHLQIEKLEAMHQIAKDAHHVAHELMKLSSTSQSVKQGNESRKSFTVSVPVSVPVSVSVSSQSQTERQTEVGRQRECVTDNANTMDVDVLLSEDLQDAMLLSDMREEVDEDTQLIDLSNELLRTSEEVWRELKTQTQQMQQYSCSMEGPEEPGIVLPVMPAEQSLHLE
jgi:hypothetical protein